jgi:hypothetical protein
MGATYLYAVIPGGESRIFDIAGIGGRSRVYSLVHGDIAAVVSASPRATYHGLQRDEAVQYLMAHQRVVERVMQSQPLLPVKFGTVLPDEARVRMLLEQGQAIFQAALDKYAGLKQMEVVVLWDLQQVFEEIGEEGPIARLKAEVASRPSQDARAERILVGQMVQEALRRRLTALRERLLPALREVGLDMVSNATMHDSIVANMALLVDEPGRAALEQRLEELDAEFGGRLTLRCVGPLPPYSFATVEAQVPSFEAVDEARRQLGLGEVVTPVDIKKSYRRVARQAHPDMNLNQPGADARMAEITRAYEFLSNYANGQGQEAEPARPLVCRFDRRSVEKTVLVAVRRQELAA